MKRRRKVEGSVRLRGRVWWVKMYDGAGVAHETPAWKALGLAREAVTTREQALDALSVLVGQKHTRTLPARAGARLTIADALDRAFMDYQARARDANPARATRRIRGQGYQVENARKWFGHLPAAESWGLSWGDLRAQIDAMRVAGLRAGTIHKYVGLIQTSLNYCKRNAMIPTLLAFPSMPTSPVRRRRPLTGEDDLIIAVIEEGAARDAIRLIQITGWRKSEAAELGWSRIDWDSTPQWIRLRTSDRKKDVTLARPLLRDKEPELYEILARWRARRVVGLDAVFHVTRRAYGHLGPPRGITGKAIAKVWEHARRRALPAIRRLPGWTPDLPALSLHDFRRKVLDELKASGADLDDIRVLMGWASINSLLRYLEGGLSDQRMTEIVSQLARYRAGKARRPIGTAVGTAAEQKIIKSRASS